jgi:hypothetical protein
MSPQPIRTLTASSRPAAADRDKLTDQTLILFSLFTAPSLSVKFKKSIDIVWLPVTDADRNRKAPVVKKDAGVEAIFWRVHVRAELLGPDLQKVLYDSTIDLPTSDKTAIVMLHGRTIKADGTEIELKKDNVFERDVRSFGSH